MANEFKENLDLVIGYTRQFIDAATPVAKQAYELGLLTLRIDAAQSLVMNLAGLMFAIMVLRMIQVDWRKAREKSELPENQKNVWKCDINDHLLGGGVPHFIGGFVSAAIGFLSLSDLINIWLWTKLFAPELWLTHQAVEKILK